MRIIRCRFTSEENLQQLSKRLNYPLDKTITEFNLSTGDIKYNSNDKPKYKHRDLSWQDTWFDMPEHNIDFYNDEYHKITFKVSKDYSIKKLSIIFNQEITKRTKSIWFPKDSKMCYRGLRFVGGDKPKYPIYVVSKGRYYNEKWHTSYHLGRCGINHFIVVEPQEVELYKEGFKNNPYAEILELSMDYKRNYNTFNNVGSENSTGPRSSTELLLG